VATIILSCFFLNRLKSEDRFDCSMPPCMMSIESISFFNLLNRFSQFLRELQNIIACVGFAPFMYLSREASFLRPAVCLNWWQRLWGATWRRGDRTPPSSSSARHGPATRRYTMLEKTLRRACLRAGIEPFTPHQLRHLYATEMLRNGAKLEVVGRILGHSSIGITADIYRHVRTGEMHEEARRCAPMGSGYLTPPPFQPRDKVYY